MTQPYPYEGSGVFSPKDTASSIPRKQVSLGGGGTFALRVMGGSGPVEVTDVRATAYLDEDFDTTNAYEDENAHGEPIREWGITDVKREDVGVYTIELTPDLTGRRGLLTLVWTYNYKDTEQTHTEYLVIREPMPTYDALTDGEKAIVEQVEWAFADLFDSTNGGPHLLETFQSHFGRERIAQLMHYAIGKINTFGAPVLRYELGTNGKKLPKHWSGILMTATYLETVKHLMRSYVEQPEFRGMNVTYTDRSSYLQRWKTIYDDDRREFEQTLRQAKREFLPLGGGSLVVAGGVFGRGGFFRPGMYAMQARGARFYPYSAVTFVRI